MYPFEWHLPYVPVLPHDLAEEFLEEQIGTDLIADDTDSDISPGDNLLMWWYRWFRLQQIYLEKAIRPNFVTLEFTASSD